MDFLFRHTPLVYFTQSLWRDEAFSVLLAERNPLTFIKITFEPPVYYILLHYWMKLFGNTELAVRSLSLMAFAIATIVVIFWAEKLFKKHWLSWFLPLFFFFNPMLLYYAFEVRAYAWFILFAVTSMYAYMERRWVLFVVATTAGLYTHTYMLLVLVFAFVHYAAINHSMLRLSNILRIYKDPMFRATAGILLLFSPWLIKVVNEFGRLKESWYYPVDLQLVKSALGNIFLAYEGTPWFFWRHTAVLSLVLLGTAAVSLIPAKTRVRNFFFVLMMIAPVAVIVGISFYKPLFVNRYLIASTISEVFVVACMIAVIQNTLVQKIVGIGAMAYVLWFNVWYPSQHAKLNIRSSMHQINALQMQDDVILAHSPLVFFESIYYSKDRSKVFLYNPDGHAFPWYVGDAIVSKNQIVRTIPPYPIRAFVLHENGTFDISYNMGITYQP